MGKGRRNEAGGEMEREPRRKGGEKARKTKFEETEMVVAEKTWDKAIGQTKLCMERKRRLAKHRTMWKR